MNKIALLLGSNLGDRIGMLENALKLIRYEVGDIQKVSSIYETEAWGVENQPSYLNQVVIVDTALQAMEVLDTILSIEEQLGRIRTEKWGARLIDIDLLFFNEEEINETRLKVPHPYMHLRRFTMAPLNEVAPDWMHQTLEASVSELLNDCPDELPVLKLNFKSAENHLA